MYLGIYGFYKFIYIYDQLFVLQADVFIISLANLLLALILGP